LSVTRTRASTLQIDQRDDRLNRRIVTTTFSLAETLSRAAIITILFSPFRTKNYANGHRDDYNVIFASRFDNDRNVFCYSIGYCGRRGRTRVLSNARRRQRSCRLSVTSVRTRSERPSYFRTENETRANCLVNLRGALRNVMSDANARRRYEHTHARARILLERVGASSLPEYHRHACVSNTRGFPEKNRNPHARRGSRYTFPEVFLLAPPHRHHNRRSKNARARVLLSTSPYYIYIPRFLRVT